MYLSRIEMTGFKSFADKTVIEFDQGMTAVVGPNGSGKSNLSEAIRWVLGEQSAKSLRGNKMEDVIFNGTQHRKPVNLAKVTLVLNNEDRYLDLDFSEISISRTYHRNGDSQYFINNEACRMKDIVDLLLDSGLGKNSFSIISQGQVEQILLNKSEDRRAIFEEAAGVQKYQYRKVEAERKLAKSQDHLSRVKDIIHELRLQMTPLEKQKAAALQYKEYKDILEKHEISLYTYQIAKHKQEWETSQNQLEQFQENSQEIEEILQKQAVALTENKQAFQDLLEQRDNLTQDYQATLQTIERYRSQKQIVQQQIDFAESNYDQQTNIYEQQKVQIEGLNQKIEVLSLEKNQKASEREEVLNEINTLLSQRKITEGHSPNELEALRSELIDLYQEKAKISNQLHTLGQQIEQSDIKLKRLKQELVSSQEKFEAQIQSTSHKQESLASLENQFMEAKQALEAQSKNQTLKKQEASNMRQNLFQLEREVSQKRSLLDNLRQSQETYSGYYSGVKAVMQANISGIHAPVAELIQVESHLQMAIETALGASSQNIVVDDDKAAKKAIQFLKEKRIGRATFLPLTNIKSKTFPQDTWHLLKSSPGVVGIASKLIQYDSQYQAIIENILGSSLVVETIDQAQRIAQQFNHRLKIVTLTGDVLLPGGSITGGHYRNNQQSMLARKNAIVDAEESLLLAEKNFKQVEEHYHVLEQDVASGDLKLDELRLKVAQMDQSVQGLRLEISQASMQINHLEKNIKIIESDIIEAEEMVTENHKIIEDSNQDLKLIAEKQSEIQSVLDKETLNADDRQASLQNIDASLNQKRTQEAILKLEHQQLSEKIQELREEITTFDLAQNNYLNENQLQAESIGQLKVDYQQLEEDLKEIETKAQKDQEVLDQLKTQRQELQVKVNELEIKEKSTQEDYQITLRKIDKLEGQIDKFQTLIDNYLTFLNEEYQLSFEMADKIAQPVESVTETQKLVRQLRKDIENLGPVNLQAIEDFDDLEIRFNHLSEQEADLLGAMSQLQDTMDEMDDEVIKRFGVTFELINQHFKVSFQRLFGGGDASLQLTNPDDLLTTGVDIIAQPPGKKKQNLALLSGGERALTAIALLFAILEAKPVPFVVLDEVEAALDDANVYRYGEYIQAFTEQTQFIVITHRKGTMESADILYGVTMEESGISKLASVRLGDAMAIEP